MVTRLDLSESLGLSLPGGVVSDCGFGLSRKFYLGLSQICSGYRYRGYCTFPKLVEIWCVG